MLIICPANLNVPVAARTQGQVRAEKFVVLKGNRIRGQFGIHQWLETPQIIASLDLAKRDTILRRQK